MGRASSTGAAAPRHGKSERAIATLSNAHVVPESAPDPWRVILPNCLCGRGLRSTAAWAASIGLGDIFNVAWLYRLALTPGSVRRVVSRAGWPGARLCRSSAIAYRDCFAQAKPRSNDPHHRCGDGLEGGNGRQAAKQVVAHPQRFRSTQRTLRLLRADRSARWRDTRPDSRRKRRDPRR